MQPMTDLQQLALAVLMGGEGWQDSARAMLDALAEKLEMPESSAVAASPMVPAKNVVTVPFERVRAVITIAPGAYFNPDAVRQGYRDWLEGEGDNLLCMQGGTLQLYEMPEGWSERVAEAKRKEREDRERVEREAVANEEPLVPPAPDFSDRAPTRIIGGTEVHPINYVDDNTGPAQLTIDPIGPDPDPVVQTHRETAEWVDVDDEFRREAAVDLRAAHEQWASAARDNALENGDDEE